MDIFNNKENLKCPRCGQPKVDIITEIDRQCSYCKISWCIGFKHKGVSLHEDINLLIHDCGDCDNYKKCFA